MIYRIAIMGALLVTGMGFTGCHRSPNIYQVAADAKSQLQRQMNQDYADKHATVQNISVVQTTAPKYEGEATLTDLALRLRIP
jgi:hypothetical protein